MKAHTQEVEQSTNVNIAVILDTIGPELRVNNRAAEGPSDTEVSFSEGSEVTLTRDSATRLTPTTIPVLSEVSFRDLQLRAGTLLHVSTFLAVGAPSVRHDFRVDGKGRCPHSQMHKRHPGP
jgi:hypothetical protein